MTNKPIPVSVAKAAMANFIKLKKQKARIEARQKKAKAKLVLFAASNRDKFDENDNYHLKGGYLHFGNETLVIPCEGFQLGAFIEKYPELVGLFKKVSYADGTDVMTLDRDKIKTGAIKSILDSEEGRKKFTTEHCLQLGTVETFAIEVK